MVRLRLQRTGRRNRPMYRVCACDSRSARDGKVIEVLGHYNPVEKDSTKLFDINRERAEYWLRVGAQPSEVVYDLFKKAGVTLPLRRRRKTRKKVTVRAD